MPNSQYDIGKGDLDARLNSQFTPDVAARIAAALGGASSVNVQTSDVSFTINPAAALAVVSPSNSAAVSGADPTPAGTYALPYDDALFITNTSGSHVPIVVAAGSAFFELNGPMTVDGGNAKVFVADATHSAAPEQITASSGSSYILAGSGDTIAGSTSASGHAVVVGPQGTAVSPITYMTGGIGADSLYGGGHSSITGGTGDHQQLTGGYSSLAVDTLVAGGGAHQVLAVGAGTTVLDDTHGSGSDTLYSGSGSDTIYTGANGAAVALGSGHATVVGGTGQDNIFVAHGAFGDSINAGGGTDYVTFNGYTVTGTATDTSTGTDTYAFDDGTSAAVKTTDGVTTIHFSGATAGTDTTIANAEVIRFGGTDVRH